MENTTMFCPFSGLKVANTITADGYIHYFIDREEKSYGVSIKADLNIDNLDYYHQYKHIFYGLWLNKKWPKSLEVIIEQEDDLKKIIGESNAPITPKQKIDHLFMAIFSKQSYEGERFTKVSFFNDQRPEFFYLKAYTEREYYMETLAEQGYLEIFDQAMGDYNFRITYKGLDYAIKMEEEGKFSKKCFVAMSFQTGMDDIRRSIKEAIAGNGFTPIIIDEQIYNSDQTINDAILANIKRSKFCVADFTHHRNGVYFEAGYALGRGLPVIYMVSKEDWSNTHFDTNHFPHVIYKDSEELKKKLAEAIQARILD